MTYLLQLIRTTFFNNCDLLTSTILNYLLQQLWPTDINYYDLLSSTTMTYLLQQLWTTLTIMTYLLQQLRPTCINNLDLLTSITMTYLLQQLWPTDINIYELLASTIMNYLHQQLWPTCFNNYEHQQLWATYFNNCNILTSTTVTYTWPTLVKTCGLLNCFNNVIPGLLLTYMLQQLGLLSFTWFLYNASSSHSFVVFFKWFISVLQNFNQAKCKAMHAMVTWLV